MWPRSVSILSNPLRISSFSFRMSKNFFASLKDVKLLVVRSSPAAHGLKQNLKPII